MFLVDAYKPKTHWFEVLECIRRLCLASAIGMVGGDSAAGPVIGLILSLIFLGVFVRLVPYKENDDSQIGVILSYSLAFIFIAALLIKVDAAANDSESDQEAFGILLGIVMFSGPLALILKIIAQEITARITKARRARQEAAKNEKARRASLEGSFAQHPDGNTKHKGQSESQGQHADDLAGKDWDGEDQVSTKSDAPKGFSLGGLFGHVASKDLDAVHVEVFHSEQPLDTLSHSGPTQKRRTSVTKEKFDHDLRAAPEKFKEPRKKVGPKYFVGQWVEVRDSADDMWEPGVVVGFKPLVKKYGWIKAHAWEKIRIVNKKKTQAYALKYSVSRDSAFEVLEHMGSSPRGNFLSRTSTMDLEAIEEEPDTQTSTSSRRPRSLSIDRTPSSTKKSPPKSAKKYPHQGSSF